MPIRPPKLRRLLPLALVWAAAACVPEPGSLDGRACDEAGACLEGWVCEEGLCVRASSPGDAGTVDGGGADGGGADAGCEPGEELCNGLDDDCDGAVDEGFPDLDGDGHAACTGVVVDCDDGNARVYAGAEEVCDGWDNDCDGVLLPGEVDADADGFLVCTPFVPGKPGLAGGGDCQDDPALGGALIHPGADEACDGLDTDCVHDPAELDGDGDGYVACARWTGAAELQGGDCDDAEAAVNPGATEVCNGRDDNCSGSVDDVPEGRAGPAVTVNPASAFTLDGAQTLEATVACDYVGCPGGGEAVLGWHATTLQGALGDTSVLTISSDGSAGVKLEPGLHLLAVTAADHCGETSVARVGVTVGTPVELVDTDGQSNFRFVCAGEARDEAFALRSGEVYSLDADLGVLSSTTNGSPFRGCTVSGSTAYVGRDSANDDVYVYPDRTDLGIRSSATLGSGNGSVTAQMMATDGLGRVWLVSANHLRVLIPPATTFEAFSKPLDGGDVTCLTYDGAGHLWVCTSTGVNRLDVSGTLAQASWLWQVSRPLMGEALRGNPMDAPTSDRATLLAANDRVLWAATSTVANTLVRLELGGIESCFGCQLPLAVLHTSAWSPSPGTGWMDLALWWDGDLFAATTAGLYRIQFSPAASPNPEVHLWHALDTQHEHRDLAVPGGVGPQTLYSATNGGVFRYRGE